MNKTFAYSERFFDDLRSLVRSYIDEKRYSHTLSVEKKAVQIANVYAHDSLNEIRTAAVLHDITKSFPFEQQLSICKKYGCPTEDVAPPVLHPITASLIISNELSKEYPALKDPVIINAVRWHATGHRDMTLPEAIIYLADYIEDTRPYKECVELRQYFENGLTDPGRDKYLHLYQTIVISFGYTIKDLISNNRVIDLNTVDAWNYYRGMIEKSEKGSLL